MLRLTLLGLITFFLCANGEKPEDTRKVHLEGLGNVVGTKYWDGEFYEFYGIPYATKPRGRDKFKAPLPPTPWEEDLKANKVIVMCHQVYYSDKEDEDEEEELLYGEEDCLVANFYVPKISSEKNLVPIIVYIHSGAFAGGNGNMAKCHHLARQDVLVVNFNYRLGAVGFACLGTKEIPGNAGLKDIIAALKFIKKHAKSFGGDPDNITLAGFSIGATLAEIVALSKGTEGLFNKLALDSGSALTPFAVNRQPIETARNIAMSIGYEDDGDIEDLNEFYLEADIIDLMAASRNFFLKNSTFGFTPCIENPANEGAVLTESPLEVMKRGNYGNYALITGFANMEGISRTSQFDKWKGLMNKNFADFLPADLVFNNDKERDAFIKELKDYYFNGKHVDATSVQGFIDYFSDSMFKYAIMKSTKLHAKNMNRPIYLYEFTYVGKLNTKHAFIDKIRGASHRDASAYILDFYDWTRNYTDMDRRDLMTTMWADFLKFENPTAYESSLLKIKWLKYTNENQNYLDLGDKLEMKKNLFAKGYELWDRVYEKYYWTPSAVTPETYKRNSNNKAKVKTKPVKINAEENEPIVDNHSAQKSTSKVAAADSNDGKPIKANPTPSNPPVKSASESKVQDTTARAAKEKLSKPNPSSKSSNTQNPTAPETRQEEVKK